MPALLAVPVFLSAFQVAAIIVGTVIVGAALIAGVVLLGQLLKPKTGAASVNTLSITLDPNAYRVIVLGKTVCGQDERYWEVYGSAGFDQVMACAGHRITSFGDLFIEGNKIVFSGASATGIIDSAGNSKTKYAGALKRYTSLVGTSGSSPFSATVGAGSLWTANASMTGLASMLLKWTYSQSKLPNGIPSRVAQVVEGSPVYDPRKDSTNGGSGSHRPNDNSTWTYSDLDSNGIPIGRNNALQMLRYLLGWYDLNTSTGLLVHVDGRGVKPEDIDFANFIAAANTCESEGYYTDCTLSTGDTHSNNESIIAAGAQGVLIDPGGLWSYFPATNDTASIAVSLTADDIVSAVGWEPKSGIADLYNQMGGNFVDTSQTSGYQQQPYPTVSNSTYITQDLGDPKQQTLDFENVLDPSLAQKLARIALNRLRLTGKFTATFNYKLLQAIVWNCVYLTFPGLGWTNKLFRVSSMGVDPMGGINATLQEEDPSVYTGGTVNTYTPPTAGLGYDTTQQIAVTSLAATAVSVSGSGGTISDALNVTWATPPANVKSIEIYYRKTTDSILIPFGTVAGDQSGIIISPLQPNTNYTVEVRFISINNVVGAFYTTVQSTTYNTVNAPAFVQTADPVIAIPNLIDSSTWTNPTTGISYIRQGGAWHITAKTSGAIVAGDLLFTSNNTVGWSFTIPLGSTASMKIVTDGADGGGSTFSPQSGGGPGEATSVAACTPGSTVITGIDGVGGSPGVLSGTVGGNSTATCSTSTPAISQTGNGGAGAGKFVDGAGGTASGGNVSNVTGSTGGSSTGPGNAGAQGHTKIYAN